MNYLVLGFFNSLWPFEYWKIIAQPYYFRDQKHTLKKIPKTFINMLSLVSTSTTQLWEQQYRWEGLDLHKPHHLAVLRTVHSAKMLNLVTNAICKKYIPTCRACFAGSSCLHISVWLVEITQCVRLAHLSTKSHCVSLDEWEEERYRGVGCGAEGGVSDLPHNQPDDLIRST